MKGTTPASWFLPLDESGEQKKGPYTSDEIMKLIMDGELKIESKIYDSNQGVWRIAADVVPFLKLASQENDTSENNPNWQPPPRPIDLKNIHVVDKNAQPTGGIDYFALVGERQKEKERHAKSDPNRGPQRFANSDQKPSPKIEPEREGSIDSPKSAGFIPELIDDATEWSKDHRFALSAAAALAFVFAGSYGMIRMLASSSKGREPAKTVESTIQKPKTSAIASPRTNSMESDSIGQGKNRKPKESGSVSVRNANTEESPIHYSKLVPGMPLPAQNPTEQYATPPPNIPAAPVVNENQPAWDQNQPYPTPPSQIDGNQGAVTPPGFIPPNVDANGLVLPPPENGAAPNNPPLDSNGQPQPGSNF